MCFIPPLNYDYLYIDGKRWIFWRLNFLQTIWCGPVCDYCHIICWFELVYKRKIMVGKLIWDYVLLFFQPGVLKPTFLTGFLGVRCPLEWAKTTQTYLGKTPEWWMIFLGRRPAGQTAVCRTFPDVRWPRRLTPECKTWIQEDDWAAWCAARWYPHRLPPSARWPASTGHSERISTDL